MATLTNTIKKIEKLTGNKVIKSDNNQFQVEHKNHVISFYANGRMEPGCSATCFYTFKKGNERTIEDVHQEYWPGTFHDNIMQAFNFINRYN